MPVPNTPAEPIAAPPARSPRAATHGRSVAAARRAPRSAFALLALLALSCAPAPIRTVREFRAAEARGDLDAARALLADDPRVWWEERSGQGTPWTLGGGRWREWDEHFRGRGEPQEWRARGDRVEIVILESNDYYALTERGAQPYLRTYFLDDRGRISGTMVSSAPGTARSAGRAEEFDAWLRATHPAEAEYLRPGGSIDPTGDRAARTREKLIEWRRAVGLPELELGG